LVTQRLPNEDAGLSFFGGWGWGGQQAADTLSPSSYFMETKERERERERGRGKESRER
jgi:hypothetical protein